MAEVQNLANRHPYLVTPSTSDLGRWAACGVVGPLLAILWSDD